MFHLAFHQAHFLEFFRHQPYRRSRIREILRELLPVRRTAPMQPLEQPELSHAQIERLELPSHLLPNPIRRLPQTDIRAERPQRFFVVAGSVSRILAAPSARIALFRHFLPF